MQIQVIFTCEACMFSIEIGKLEVDGSRPAHVTPFGVQLSGKESVHNREKEGNGEESHGDGQQGA